MHCNDLTSGYSKKKDLTSGLATWLKELNVKYYYTCKLVQWLPLRWVETCCRILILSMRDWWIFFTSQYVGNFAFVVVKKSTNPGSYCAQFENAVQGSSDGCRWTPTWPSTLRLMPPTWRSLSSRWGGGVVALVRTWEAVAACTRQRILAITIFWEYILGSCVGIFARELVKILFRKPVLFSQTSPYYRSNESRINFVYIIEVPQT
jgi:hypothetical protein